MNQQTRRQFFKTVAATVATGTAVVAVSAVAKTPIRVIMYKGTPFCYQPDLGDHKAWSTYYDDFGTVNPALATKLDRAIKQLKFTPPIRK